MECMTRIQIGRHWRLSEGCFLADSGPPPHCRIDVPPRPHWLVTLSPALQSLQSLGKGNSPIQSFNCLFVRMIWTSEAKSRAKLRASSWRSSTFLSRTILPEICVAQAMFFDLDMSHVFCPYFFRAFPSAWQKKQRSPSECAKRRIAETSTLETLIFGILTHLSGVHAPRFFSWNFFATWMSEGYKYVSSAPTISYGIVDFRHWFHPISSALLHSAGPRAGPGLSVYNWWLELLVSQAQLTAAVWRDLGKTGEGGKLVFTDWGWWCWW